MKLVFIFSSTYPHYTGGIETWVYQVCQRLINSHEITIFTIQDYRNERFTGSFEDIHPNINFIPVKNLNHIPVVKHLVHKYIALLNTDITAYQMYRKAIKFLNREDRYYLIGLGTVFPAKTVRLIKRKRKNVRAVVSCRGPEPEVLAEDYPGTGRIMEKLQKKNVEHMDAVWANGLDTQMALKNKGYESIVIKNGIDARALELETAYDYKEMGLEAKTIVATIGTVSKIKGYYEIIEAVSILSKRYGLKIDFVGIGKVNTRTRKRFELYAKNLGVSEQIHLIGEHRAVVSYAKGADVMLCTSGGGGYGHAALEAMASSTPIVAWDSMVYQQLLCDGESARLVKEGDADALAEGIYYVINHKREAQEWGRRAKQRAEQFDWSIVVKEIENALAELG